MPHPTALFALNDTKMQCQRRFQISRVKNISNFLEQSGVAFRLAPPYGGLFVNLNELNELSMIWALARFWISAKCATRVKSKF